ncbi:MAG TPA: hypothetical protein VLX28_07050 [Thermoanaerobaculia bacterium]|nr:hypothetical protein [Thermoanaerobaculia bacterium]
MKCRRTLLLLAVFLLLAPLAGGAAAASEPATPAVSTPAASPFCAASLTPVKQPGADAVPSPVPAAISQYCGVCSDSYCQGALANSTCFFLTRFGYQQGRCALWLGDRCPEDNKWDCLCTNQPLP